MATFKIADTFEAHVAAQHGVVVMRGVVEVEFFHEKKAAGSWIQHVYGLRPWDAQKQAGIVIKSIRDRGPRAGDTITYRGGGRYDYLLKGDTYNPDKTERCGILDHSYGHDSFGITFSASAFRTDNSISCSGGPVPCIQAESLTFLGFKVTRFWRWHEGFQGGGQGGDYTINVPHWLWSGE